jgi:hypothetical protein
MTAPRPTDGLVPFTSIFPIQSTLDHTGPLAATERTFTSRRLPTIDKLGGYRQQIDCK